MRQITLIGRTLVVLAVSAAIAAIATAFPLVAIASNGGPYGS
jgi:hypothetical protein